MSRTPYRTVITTVFLCTLLAIPLQTEAQQSALVGENAGVKLTEIAKANENGRVIGSDYVADNTNRYPVSILLKITEKDNVYDGVVWIPLRVEAGQRAYLGWVVQSDNSRSANWEYEWQINRVD